MVRCKTVIQMICFLGLFLLITGTVSAAPDIPIQFGQTIQGNITVGGQTDIYTVTAYSGDTLYLRMSSGMKWANRIQLRAPNGTLLDTIDAGEFDHSALKVVQVYNNGTYRIVCQYRSGTATGPYGIFVQRINKPGNAVPIIFGNISPSSIDGLAETDTYVFRANAGDSIYARFASSLVSANQIRLYARNGTRIAKATASEFGHTTGLFIQFDVNGTYTLLTSYDDYMGGPKTGPGGIFIQRTNNPGKTVFLNFGDTRQKTITSYGEFASYKFRAYTTDTVYIRMSSEKKWTNHLHLYAPNGTLIEEKTAGEFSTTCSITRLLDATGNYTVLAGFAGGTETGNITVDLDLLGTSRVIPDFTATPRYGIEPLTVRFTDTSQNIPVSWRWDFGDGSTVNSSRRNPVHTYSTAGRYSVTLNATNAYGSIPITKPVYITVTGPVAVKSITPAAGVRGRLLVISNLSGTNFSAGAKVFLNQTGYPLISATNVSVASPGKITCTFPIPADAPLGLRNVNVKNINAPPGIKTKAFMVRAPAAPIITGMQPGAGKQGTLVTVTNLSGAGFIGTPKPIVQLTRGSAVIRGTNVTVINPEKITCTFKIPAMAATGSWNATVINGDNQKGLKASAFYITLPVPPTTIGPYPR